ncbi:hypothetical protein KP509_09G013700 [Ceratopteris richardii]|nr:hypothetical protein KP509_09G013700 [Ceratopteris richardii]
MLAATQAAAQAPAPSPSTSMAASAAPATYSLPPLMVPIFLAILAALFH